MIKGLQEVLSNLKIEVEKIEAACMEGITESSIEIIEDTDTSSPVVPVDTSNLKESRFVVTSQGTIEYGESPNFKDRGRDGTIKADPAEVADMHNQALSDALGKAEKSGKIVTVSGFSVDYATKVHEGIGIGTYHRPGSGAKFFDSSIKTHVGKIAKNIFLKVKRLGHDTFFKIED